MLPEAQRCGGDLGPPGATGTLTSPLSWSQLGAEAPSRCAVTGELWLSMVRLEQCLEAHLGSAPALLGPRVAVGIASHALLPVPCKVCRELHFTLEPLLIPICVWKNTPVGVSQKKCLQN